jgi:secretory carrier-associated membrane protein
MFLHLHGKQGSTPPIQHQHSMDIAAKEEAIKQRELQLHLQLRQQELAQKENELKLREAELRNQQAKVNNALATGKMKNFPWIWPVMYHNIEEEVPTEHKRACRALFWGWKATVATLFINMATCLVMLMAHAQGINTAASDLGASIVYFVMVGVGSLYLWYRPVYSAFIRNSGLYYYVYFLFNGIQIAFNFYMFVGIPGTLLDVVHLVCGWMHAFVLCLYLYCGQTK